MKRNTDHSTQHPPHRFQSGSKRRTTGRRDGDAVSEYGQSIIQADVATETMGVILGVDRVTKTYFKVVLEGGGSGRLRKNHLTDSWCRVNIGEVVTE